MTEKIADSPGAQKFQAWIEAASDYIQGDASLSQLRRDTLGIALSTLEIFGERDSARDDIAAAYDARQEAIARGEPDPIAEQVERLYSDVGDIFAIIQEHRV